MFCIFMQYTILGPFEIKSQGMPVAQELLNKIIFRKIVI